MISTEHLSKLKYKDSSYIWGIYDIRKVKENATNPQMSLYVHFYSMHHLVSFEWITYSWSMQRVINYVQN